MVRLIDLLMHAQKTPEKIKTQLERCKLIVADNVAHYYWRGTDQEEWDIQDDFPNVAPPFQHCFIEFKIPAYSLSKEFGMTAMPGELGGCMLTALDYSLEKHSEIAKHFNLKGLENRFEGTPKWVVVASPIVKFRGHQEIVSQTVTVMFFVGESGKVLTTIDPLTKERHYYLTIAATKTIASQDMLLELSRGMMPMVHVALLALSFMHCKNVELVEVVPSPKLAAAHWKRSGLQLHRYSVIEIDPMMSKIKSVCLTEGVGPRQALHLCRGHFKTYRGRGLFGKYTGTYWWHPQERGSAKMGTVESSYLVTRSNLEV